MKAEEKAKANEVRMSVEETPPIIRKVEMVAKGVNGLVVTYASTEIRNKIGSPIEHKKTQKRPVQRELRNYFDLTKEHLLRCCGYHWSNETVLEMLKQNIEVTYILMGPDDKFMLGGKNKIKEYGVIALNTPLVDSNEYDEWEELEEIIGKIMAETKLFMSGVKGADSRQVTIDYMKSKQNVENAEKSYDEMSEEEREILMKEAFGNFGLEIVEENGKMVVGVSEGEAESKVEKSEKKEKAELVANKATQKNDISKNVSHPKVNDIQKNGSHLTSEVSEEPLFEDDVDMPMVMDESMEEAPLFDESEEVATPKNKKK